MSLSFITQQTDTPGTLCYVIHGNRTEELEAAAAFQGTVHQQIPGKVCLIDKNSHDARAILEFYAITDTRFPISLLVREDDALAYEWSSALPTTEDVLYHLNQIGD